MYNVEIKPKYEIVEKVNIDYKLRWIGFKIGDEIATITFKDKEGNNWNISAESIGCQSMCLSDEIEKFFDNNKEELLKLVNSTQEKNEVISYLQSLVSEANNGSLEEEHLKLMQYLYDNDCLGFSENCWIEIFCKVSKDGKVIFDDYLANFFSGDYGIFESYDEVKGYFQNNERVEDLIKQLNPIFTKIA